MPALTPFQIHSCQNIFDLMRYFFLWGLSSQKKIINRNWDWVKCILMNCNSAENIMIHLSPLDTGRKLNVHKTFRKRSGRLLNAYVRSVYVLCLRGSQSLKNCFMASKFELFDNSELKLYWNAAEQLLQVGI